jgi:hypothetical protein
LKRRSKSKVKGQWVKVMVSNERSRQKEYTSHTNALPPTNQKLQPRL